MYGVVAGAQKGKTDTHQARVPEMAVSAGPYELRAKKVSGLKLEILPSFPWLVTITKKN